MSEKIRVDLSLLKNLVSELETILDACQTIKDTPVPDKETAIEFITEMSKASGLSAGISQEASALMMDCMNEVKGAQSPSKQSLDKLLGLDKIDGGYGGGGYGGSGGGKNFN
jgi:hypothetical protein